MGKISDLIGPIGGQTKNTQASSGGKIASLLSTVKNNPTISVTQNQPKKTVQTSSPSLISSAPQIVSGIAKGINIGNLIITAATRQPTQPQVDVSKVKLPTAQPQAPQKTISIAPNQKVLTPSQLKIVAPTPVAVAGKSGTMKPAKPGSPTMLQRNESFVKSTMPESLRAADQVVKDVPRIANDAKSFIKDPRNFQSSSGYDATNTDGLVKSFATKKITDFLHLPHEVPGIIESVAKTLAGQVGQGISLAMQEKLNPPKTVSESVGLKAKQVSNAVNIALTPINALFTVGDNVPYVKEFVRAAIIPLVAVGELGKASIGKLVDALPISEKAKNDIKEPLGDLAALAAQVILGHTLGKVTGEGLGKLNDVGKEAFTKMTKDIVETSGGKSTVSFSPQDVRKVAIFNERGKYHKELVDILAEKGKSAGDLWTKAVKEGITIELPFEKVVGMIDKPWWGKIKKFLNMEPTNATTTTQVPGRVAGPGTAGVPVEKQILGLLPEKVNHNPQAVINAVIKSGLDKTPEGKGLIVASLEAQQKGVDLTIVSKNTTSDVSSGVTDIVTKNLEKTKAEGISTQVNSDGYTIVNSNQLNMSFREYPDNIEILGTKRLTEGIKGEPTKILEEIKQYAAAEGKAITATKIKGTDIEYWKKVGFEPIDVIPGQDYREAIWEKSMTDGADKNIAAKEAQQTKVIDQASKPPKDSLVQEAKKYKSAEEFINSKYAAISGRVKTAEIDNVFSLLEDGTTAEKGLVVKKGNQIFPVGEKGILAAKNSNISLNPDGSIKEGFGLTKASFLDDTNVKDQLTELWNKAQEKPQKEAETSVVPKEENKIVENKPVEDFSKPNVEDMAKRLELQQAANAEMAAIPTNTDAQTPVGTGELKRSKAYTRVYDMLKEEYREDVTYNVLNLKKDAEAAVDFLEKDPKAAIRISLGLEQPPVGQTETAISMAVSEKAMRDGEHALQGRVESSLSLRRTRGGQENASLRGRFGDDSAHKYMRELLNRKMTGLGVYVKDAISEMVGKGQSMKQAAIDKIDSEAKKIKESIRRDRKKIQLAQDIINSLICK